MNVQRVLRWLTSIMVAIGVCSIAEALVNNSTPATVLAGNTYFYTTYGSGDVIFRLAAGMPSQCVGFWLRSSDPGQKNDLTALMTAIATQQALTVYADPTQTWPGSTSAYCLVYMIAL